MAIRLPISKLSDAPRSQKRPDNTEAILQVMGENPYAQAINQIGPALSQALQRRAELRKQAQQTAKIEQAYGLQPGELAGLPADTATSIGKTVYDKQHPSGKPTFLGTSENGKELLFMNENGNLSTQLNPIGGPLAGKTRDPLADERLGLQRERVSNDIVNRFNADPNVKKAQSAIDAATNVRSLIDSRNPIAANAIPTYMARASGEVGNLSEADKRPFGGSQAILARLEAALTQKATGQLTPENAAFIKSLADTMESSANKNIDNLARMRAKQYSRGGRNETSIYQMLRPGMGQPGLQPLPVGEPQKKATHRWNPATGKVELVP